MSTGLIATNSSAPKILAQGSDIVHIIGMPAAQILMGRKWLLTVLDTDRM
jgi:hypothetical protein